MISKSILLALMLILMANSCGLPTRAKDDHGLKRVNLKIPAEDYDHLLDKGWSKNKVLAQMQADGQSWEVEVGYSGKTTIDSVKRNYKIDFRLGERFRNHATYRLHAQSSDDTGLRSLVGFEIFRRAGFHVPDFEPVSLYINGVYKGLYYLLEPIDEDFFAIRGRRFASLFKAQFGSADFSPQNIAQPRSGWDEKNPDNKSYDDLIRLLQIINAPDQWSELKQAMDIDQYIRYITVAVYINHCDGYRNNFYLYRDAEDDVFRILPWDLDRCLFLGDGSELTEADLFGIRTELSEKVFALTSSHQYQKSFFCQLRTELLSSEDISSFALGQSKIIQKAYESDPIRQFLPPGSFIQHRDQLLDSLSSRLENMAKHPYFSCD